MSVPDRLRRHSHTNRPLSRVGWLVVFRVRAIPHSVFDYSVSVPSTAGTWRDPNNFGKEWRNVRESLGVAEVTTHSFRKTVATLIDDEGLSARVGADQLDHARVSMTQDRYMTRGKVHTEVADLLDRAINDE